MKVLAKKTSMRTVLTLELAVGIIIMAAAFIVVPIGVFSLDPSYITNVYMWITVLAVMIFFGSVGFFFSVYPFYLFTKLPEVQAETDGTYLYIHSKKEAKIPLAEMEGTYIDAEIPYILSSEFLVHLLSERYGKVIIKVPGHGKFKLYFISNASQVPETIATLIKSNLP